jgi:hypothetical protein
MKANARKKDALVFESAEQFFRMPTERELQQRHLEALEICADWKKSVERRRQRLLLRAELIGGVEEDEVEELRQDAERLRRCMEVLAWRPQQ